MKKYTCPSCKEEQTTTYQWQTASIPYLFDLTLKSFGSMEIDDIIVGDHESWNCPNCGEKLPPKITEKLFKLL